MIYELLKDRILNGGAGSEAIIQSLSISANGVYTASSGVDGYSPITVNVPQKEPNIQNLAISANGTYTAPADIDGYNPITVNVPQKEPNIQNLSITANGTYTAPSGTDGYSPVVVDVQPDLENITITTNGTYTHTGKDGYDQVVVNVPQQGLTEVTIKSGSLQYLDYKDIWNPLINQLTDIYLTGGGMHQAFVECYNLQDLSHLTIHIEGKKIWNINGMFLGCENLRKLPILKPNELNRLGDESTSVIFNAMFNGCSSLKEIPYNYLSQLHNSTKWGTPYIGLCQNVFHDCNRLRELPDLKFMNGSTMGLTGSASSANGYIGNGRYSLGSCVCLNEVIDMPLPSFDGTNSGDICGNEYSLYRIKNFTFMKVDGQVQERTNINNVHLNLQKCGYAPSGSNLDINLDRLDNSAKVSTLEDYNRLKTDPDWWTDNADFSRYNYTSAKNTIESLPILGDSGSAAGTLALKRYAGQGYGKCPNDLTNEELAVATRKGWTVALSTV